MRGYAAGVAFELHTPRRRRHSRRRWFGEGALRRGRKRGSQRHVYRDGE